MGSAQVREDTRAAQRPWRARRALAPVVLMAGGVHLDRFRPTFVAREQRIRHLLTVGCRFPTNSQRTASVPQPRSRPDGQRASWRYGAASQLRAGCFLESVLSNPQMKLRA